MPNLLAEIDEACGQSSSYDKPLAVIGDWRFFVDEDGFIPSGENTKLVGKVLALNKEASRYYVSIIGTADGGTFSHTSGESFPKEAIENCVIDRLFVVQRGVSAVKAEVEAALRRLVDLVKEKEQLAA